MDVDIGRWILEYLLRQPLDDRTLNFLVSVLPLPNNHSRSIRTLLLRRIESTIQNCTISEKLLEFLEQIEELNYREGIIVTESMKAAYCAVAVHCTSRFLEENEGIEMNINAVNRIWMNRVCKIEGLGSEELKQWKDEIEKGVSDECVRKKLLFRIYGFDAVEVVRVYVEEEKERIGPSFLELVAEKLGDYDTVRKVFGLKENGLSDQVTEAETIEETCRGNVPKKSKSTGNKRLTDAKICDTDGLEDRAKREKINRVDKPVDSSALEPQEVANDTLSNPLYMLAETAIASLEGVKPDREIEVSQFSSHDQHVNAAYTGLNNPCCKIQKNIPNPSLMTRNGTDQTHGWDDSIDNISNGTRLQVPIPKKMVNSPSKKNEISKLWTRRKIRRWSTLEEDTLRTGVQKYGKGNWKFILNAYLSVFEARTEVDLKDKWRNMTRSRKL